MAEEQIILNRKDIYWLIKKLSIYYYLENIRAVIRFLSTKVKNLTEEGQE